MDGEAAATKGVDLNLIDWHIVPSTMNENKTNNSSLISRLDMLVGREKATVVTRLQATGRSRGIVYDHLDLNQSHTNLRFSCGLQHQSP